jgi:hypothetical protein
MSRRFAPANKPRQAWRHTRVAAVAAALFSAPLYGVAQSAAPAGSPTDLRYTPVHGPATALFPREQSDGAPRAVPGTAAANVARVLVDVDRDGLPADGQSGTAVRVRLLDAQGRALTAPALITIEHSGGRVLLDGARTDEAGSRPRDASRELPGVQVQVRGGELRFTLLAPHEPQDVRLRITAGREVAEGVVSFLPELRPMIASGLVEGVLHFRNRVALQAARRGDAFEQDIERWSREFNGARGSAGLRTAFYVKGMVRGDVLLTAAFDSDKETRARLLRDIRPDELYPVLGDSSLRSFDARSASRLYLRLDSGKSYVLYGDFVTGDGFSQALGFGAVASLTQRSLGQVNRTATGLRAHHENGALTTNVFVVNDSLRQVVEEFGSQGSGPYGLRNNAVLEGSEKVEVVVRDRFQPSRIVRVTPLARLVDYSFEPFSGRILLMQFLPAVDADLNPLSLRISYEVDQGGEKFWLGGVDAQLRLGSAAEVGGSVLSDRNPLAPYELLSANATWRFGPKSALVVEVARSTSEVNTNNSNQSGTPALRDLRGEVQGQAWRAELVHEGQRGQARVFLGRSEPGFNNPAAPLHAGRGEALVQGKYTLLADVDLLGQALKSEDRNPGGGERALAELSLRWRATSRLTLEAGLRQRDETVGFQGNSVSSVPFGSQLGLTGSIASGSGGGALGFGNQPLDPATGLPLVNSGNNATSGGGLAAATTPLRPGTELESRTVRLGLGWRASERVTLGGEVEHGLSGDDLQRLALGGDVLLFERTRLYGRFEHQSGWTSLQGVSNTGGKANAFVLGVDSSVIRDTQLFSEYRLRDAVAGRDLQLASGARRQWVLSPGLGVSGGIERIQVLSGEAATATAVYGGLEWTGSELWRGATRLELRRSADLPGTLAQDEQFTTSLWTAMLARKLSRDWTLLARQYSLLTDYRSRGDIAQHRLQFGLAWRETDTNRSNALGKIEFKRETDASHASVGELQTRATVLSLHAEHHPSRPWWLSGRVAAKWQNDRFEAGAGGRFRAQLLAGRITYDLSERWDLGLNAAWQWGQNGARQRALGVEAGYLVQENLWLSLGVNASGFRADRDLSAGEPTQRGVYLRLRFKFDETLFQGGDREVNRSLNR